MQSRFRSSTLNGSIAAIFLCKSEDRSFCCLHHFLVRWLPIQVRIILSIAWPPRLGSSTIGSNLITSSVGISIFIEIAIGLTAGLTLTILFAAMLLAGEKIATSSGLGFAQQIDPTSGARAPIVSQILYLLLIVVFVSIDGHLLAIATMLESYQILPVGLPVAPEILFSAGIRAAGSMFVAAAIIMLPITMIMLMINVGVGVISRSAPTLNLFSFGFPITLMAVFILLYFSVGVLGNNAQDLVNNGLSNMQTLIGDLADG